MIVFYRRLLCAIYLSGDSEPGDYDEKSIRYTGRNIPSKSFRLLQSMTGGPGGDSTPPTGSQVLTNQQHATQSTSLWK